MMRWWWWWWWCTLVELVYLFYQSSPLLQTASSLCYVVNTETAVRFRSVVKMLLACHPGIGLNKQPCMTPFRYEFISALSVGAIFSIIFWNPFFFFFFAVRASDCWIGVLWREQESCECVESGRLLLVCCKHCSSLLIKSATCAMHRAVFAIFV